MAHRPFDQGQFIHSQALAEHVSRYPQLWRESISLRRLAAGALGRGAFTGG